MLHFLPQKNSKSVIFEYWLRAASVFLGFLSIAFLLALGLILPSCIISSYKNNAVKSQLEMTKNMIGSTNMDLTKNIKEVNYLASFLSPTAGYNKAQSSLIQSALNLAGNEIKISSIKSSPSKDDVIILVFQGVSMTRDSLITFTKNLKDSGLFSSVDLPVSSLVKDLNVDFSITLIYKLK